MGAQPIVGIVLLLLGLGFLVANARVVLEYARFRRRRRGAILVWTDSRPQSRAISIAIGAVLGVVILYKLLALRQQAFGETMMFLYYAYLLPLSRRVGRGFYEEGIMADTAFISYQDVGGVTWREGEHTATLVVMSRLRNLARSLIVPGDQYGAARRVLRDKIGARVIRFGGGGLDLGTHDDREDV